MVFRVSQLAGKSGAKHHAATTQLGGHMGHLAPRRLCHGTCNDLLRAIREPAAPTAPESRGPQGGEGASLAAGLPQPRSFLWDRGLGALRATRTYQNLLESPLCQSLLSGFGEIIKLVRLQCPSSEFVPKMARIIPIARKREKFLSGPCLEPLHRLGNCTFSSFYCPPLLPAVIKLTEAVRVHRIKGTL